MASTIRVGDHGMQTTGELTSDGSPADISGAAIYLVLTLRGGTDVFMLVEADNDQVGDGDDGTKGHVSYTWQDGDTMDGDEGLYKAGWMVSFGGGELQSFPSAGYGYVAIEPRLGEIAS